MSEPVIQSAIQVAQALKTGINVTGSFQRTDSLIAYTKDCRVEPITLIDEKVIYLPFLGDILQTANSIFAGYYLQAVSVDAVVGNVQVLKRLDKFNPTRSPYIHTVEDFKEGLPKFGIEAEDPHAAERWEMDKERFLNQREDRANQQEDRANKLANERTDRNNKNAYHASGDAKAIKDSSNLAVGKLIEVTLKHNDQEFVLPIAIRLNTKTIDTQSLLHILGQSKDNKSRKERYHGWKSGELQFWRDIVFAEDLIKAHRTTLAKDKSGVYAEMMKRRNTNALSTVMSHELSVGTASNICLISDSTRKELEFQIGGKLSDFRTRERVFADTYMMMLFVIDAEYEQVTIYHRGLNMSTDMSVKEMKMASKNENTMITDVLKAFISGHAPTF